MDSIELHQQAQAKKFREDVASKVEDILVRVDQKLNDYQDDRVNLREYLKLLIDSKNLIILI